MSLIFRWQDSEGDEFEVQSMDAQRLVVGCNGRDEGTAGSYLPRSEVLSLIQALTEWAYPTHTPEGPNRSLIEELIVRAVKDQVSAVLPLHLSPVSRRVCAAQGGCEDSSHDPEPGDVAHPRPPAESVSEECTRCGHRWGNHNPQGCQLSTCTCTKPLAAEGGRCTALLQPGERLAGTHDACGMLWVTHRPAHPLLLVAEDGPCADCGHGKDRHRPVCASWRESGKGVCRCNAYKAPAAEVIPPEVCRCGHGKDRHRPHCAVVMRDDHGVICRCDGFGPSLPVRTPERVETHRHECGLCKQPWSDGHGQPGDPCFGVEAARQHPNDWTDALWRVKQLCGACAAGNHPHVFRPCAQTGCACTESAPEPTSAPASESIYCDGCGHSWVSHWESLGRCVSTVGKGTCECTRRPE